MYSNEQLDDFNDAMLDCAVCNTECSLSLMILNPRAGKVCRECDEKLDDGYHYCYDCGNWVEKNELCEEDKETCQKCATCELCGEVQLGVVGYMYKLGDKRICEDCNEKQKREKLKQRRIELMTEHKGE